MRLIVIIPARGGSKRLPGKNIRSLGGIPLISWTIRSAKKIQLCCDVIVSTDDLGIAEIALEDGAQFQGVRPPELSTDTAKSSDVVLFETRKYEEINGKVDGIILLQPTSPFRSIETLNYAVSRFVEGNALQSFVSLSKARSIPAWCFKIENGKLDPFLGWNILAERSQEVEEAWELNGSFYLISPEKLEADGAFLSEMTVPICCGQMFESIDIDDQDDWIMAEIFLKMYPSLADC